MSWCDRRESGLNAESLGAVSPLCQRISALASSPWALLDEREFVFQRLESIVLGICFCARIQQRKDKSI